LTWRSMSSRLSIANGNLILPYTGPPKVLALLGVNGCGMRTRGDGYVNIMGAGNRLHVFYA
jgi:hypothetical protein